MKILFLTQAAVKKKQIDKATYLRCMSNYLQELDTLDATTIVKPHPKDDTNYDMMTNDCPKVVVCYGDVHKFISASDVVISFRSSTILDAMIAEKPVIVIDLLDEAVSKRYDLSRENKALMIMKRDDCIVDVLKQVIDDKKRIIAKQNEYIKNFFYKLDGKSHERVAQYIYDTLTIQK